MTPTQLGTARDMNGPDSSIYQMDMTRNTINTKINKQADTFDTSTHK